MEYPSLRAAERALERWRRDVDYEVERPRWYGSVNATVVQYPNTAVTNISSSAVTVTYTSNEYVTATTNATNVTAYNNWWMPHRQRTHQVRYEEFYQQVRREAAVNPIDTVQRIQMGMSAEEQQRAARARQQQDLQTQAMHEAQRRAAASARARSLLLSCLNAEQRAMFERSGKFRVVGSAGGIYEIRQGRTHNIHKLNAYGTPIEEWCVHVEANVPDCDNMLAQKLELETNEGGLRRMANIWSLPNKLMIHHAERQARFVEAQTLEEMLRVAA